MRTHFFLAIMILLISTATLAADKTEKMNVEPYTEKQLEQDIASLDKKYETDEKRQSAEYATAKGQLIAKFMEAIYQSPDSFAILTEKGGLVRTKQKILETLWEQGGKWAVMPLGMLLTPLDKKGEIGYADRLSLPKELEAKDFVSQVQAKRIRTEFKVAYSVDKEYRSANSLPMKADEKGLFEFVEGEGRMTGWILYINCPDKKAQKAKMKLVLSDKKDILVSAWLNGQQIDKFEDGKNAKIEFEIGTNSLVFITQNNGKLEVGIKLEVSGKNLKAGVGIR